MATAIDGFATAGTMLDALRRREISAVELLELHLARIARHNPRLNAVVIPNDEAARTAAERADAARARGEDGRQQLGNPHGPSLLGLPFTVKDAVEVAGLRATAGVPEHAARVSTTTAPVAARMLAAGAVLLGKTNIPPWVHDWQADNAVFGRTNNPWNADRTPGGSTGGGAAAVAAGLTPLELGSDLGGSIRVPAGWCGVYGHRPSETAVPQSGHFPGSAWPNTAFPLGSIGPLARSAEDLELALDVVAGPEDRDAVAWRLDLPPPRADRLAGLRVAVLPPVDWLPVRAELAAAQEDLASRLSRAGARVAEARPEGFGDLREHHELLQTIFACVNGARTWEGRRAEAAAFRAEAGPFAEARARGREAMAFEYIGLFARRERFRAAWRAFFRDWDVWLTPLALTEALPHDTTPMPERAVDVDGAPVMQWLTSVYPGLTVLGGLPATAFPVGFTRGGLPIGLQAVGPYLEDRTPIRFAALVARELGLGFRAPPGFD